MIGRWEASIPIPWVNPPLRYPDKEAFAEEVRLVFSNCAFYNEDDSEVGGLLRGGWGCLEVGGATHRWVGLTHQEPLLGINQAGGICLQSLNLTVDTPIAPSLRSYPLTPPPSSSCRLEWLGTV